MRSVLKCAARTTAVSLIFDIWSFVALSMLQRSQRGDYIAKKKYKAKLTQREIELLSFILHRVYEETKDQLIRGFCKRIMERFEFTTDWDQ